MAFDRMQSYGPSKLGITSVAGQRAMAAQTRSVQNEIQEQKRTERLGRRAYRAAARGKDPSNYLKGIAALEQMRAINGTSGAGIKMAGVRQRGIEKGLASTRGQIESLNSRTVDEQGRIAPKPQSRLLGTMGSDGTRVDQLRTSSSGGEWVNVGPGASPEQASQAPIVSPYDLAGSIMNPMQAAPQILNPSQPESGPLDSRLKFANDLRRSESIRVGDSSAMSLATQRAQRLGISQNSLMSFLNRNMEESSGVSLVSRTK